MIRLDVAALLLVSVGSAYAGLRGVQGMPEAAPEHTRLMKGVGEWKGTLTMSMPGMPDETVPCKESVTSIGEFWTSSQFECELMGMPFHGHGVNGYDTARKVYVGTWVDSTTTFLVVMEGHMDPAKNALVMRYTAPDMTTGELAPHRVETVTSDDAYTSTFFVGEGEGTKHMLLEMKRVK